jgi:hypothetical protein
MANDWINYVKSIAEKEKVSYPVALMKAKETYKKKEITPATPATSPALAPKKKPVSTLEPVKVGKNKNLK